MPYYPQYDHENSDSRTIVSGSHINNDILLESLKNLLLLYQYIHIILRNYPVDNNYFALVQLQLTIIKDIFEIIRRCQLSTDSEITRNSLQNTENNLRLQIMLNGSMKMTQFFGSIISPLPFNTAVYLPMKIKPPLTKNQQILDSLAISEELIPQEFYCQISSQIMDEPVYDSITQVRINKKEMLIALSEKGENPFSQQPLTPEQLISDSLLASKINLFVAIVKDKINEINDCSLPQQKIIMKKILNWIDNHLQNRDKMLVTVTKDLRYFPQAQAKVNLTEFLKKHGSPYNILGLTKDSTPTEIANTYRRLTLDRKNNFQILTEARNLLLDESSKTKLDALDTLLILMQETTKIAAPPYQSLFKNEI